VVDGGRAYNPSAPEGRDGAKDGHANRPIRVAKPIGQSTLGYGAVNIRRATRRSSLVGGETAVRGLDEWDPDRRCNSLQISPGNPNVLKGPGESQKLAAGSMVTVSAANGSVRGYASACLPASA
jgi:hypothetical protein